MMEDPSFFKSKRVIELGSGLGLVGISVLRALEPECFLFTDCNLSVLDILQKNIELNANEKAFKCLQYSVEQLDWQHCKENHIFQQDYDIVLAADVVFDTSLVPSLVSVLSRLLSKQRDAVAVLSTTVRNEGTYVYFKQVLG
jgi:predicted nicotinamide N-methyase